MKNQTKRTRPVVSMILLAVVLVACTTGPATGTVTPSTATMAASRAASRAPTDAPAATATALPATSIPSTATATREPPAAVTRNKIQYTVKPGDALSVIAKQHGVSMAAIQLANDMDENSALLSGQKLEIPVGPTWEGESTFWIVHVVQVGESLTTLAQMYRVAQSDLIRVNGIADPSIVRLGSRLVIPLDGPYVAAAPPPATPTRPATLPPTTSTRSASAATPTLPGAAPTAASSTATPRPPSNLPTSTPGAAQVPPEVASWPNTVVGWINDRRAQNGLPRYVISPALMQAAQAHANDISSRGFGSHVGTDGSNLLSRMVRAGYTPSYYSENWGQANTPEEAVNWWYNETPPNDPHRQNILSRVYLEVGVGVSRANNGFYFVADFGVK